MRRLYGPGNRGVNSQTWPKPVTNAGQILLGRIRRQDDDSAQRVLIRRNRHDVAELAKRNLERSWANANQRFSIRVTSVCVPFSDLKRFPVENHYFVMASYWRVTSIGKSLSRRDRCSL